MAPLVLVKTNWIPSSRMAQINGYEYFVTSFGQLVGTSGVVVLIAVLGGWRNMLITLGAVGIALAVAWFLLYKENDKVGAIKMPGKQPFIAPLKKALKQKAIWLLAIGWPGTTLVWIAFTTFWPRRLSSMEAFSSPIWTRCLAKALLLRWFSLMHT